MLADDYGSTLIPEECILRDVKGLIEEMIARVEHWTAPFTIIREHKKQVWIEQIVLLRDSSYVFTKKHLVPWSFWYDIRSFLTGKVRDEVVDYNGLAYRAVTSLEFEQPASDVFTIARFKEYSEAYQRVAGAKRLEAARRAAAHKFERFRHTTPPF